MIHLSKTILVILWMLTTPAGLALAVDDPEIPLDFQRDVRPLLSEYCFHCHGPDSATREADLRLDTTEALEAFLGNDDSHGLRERLESEDADLRMPPPEAKQPSASERRRLVRWLNEGAKFSGHWSFSKVERPAVPDVAGSQSAIDAFIDNRLQRAGIKPNGRADHATLLRRLSVAVTGLIPSANELSNFENRVAQLGEQKAIDAALDRLFASPAYGEHMAYPWLEAARYADTDGYQNDRYRYQDAWRDWVIRAFNEKKPYSEFVTEQLAGDLLPNATLWQQVATGFGRNHRINSEDGSIEEEWRVENVVDRVDTFGTVFLGLTVGCARCHDHKYDPLSQREYYELFAYFNNISEYGIGPNNGNTPPFIELPKSWPQLSANENRAIVPDPVKLSRARKEAGNGLRRPQPGQPGTVMVMHELEKPRETYLLMRGQYNAPDKSRKLSPGVPESINASQRRPKNRVELAKWLIDRKNPLTARVAVNRLWQQCFGVGLVESSENFGAQGTLPTHPQLLDWLACELMDSDWDLVHVQRLILTSQAFARSSAISRTSQARDSANRLLWRGPKVRLTAPELRDAALLASGLMVRDIGGPSVKPYMPPKIWSSISNNKYKQDTGGALFRRSLYTYWRRTIPPPTMVGFNAATRETCSVRNEITNTPLQALTLLNNKTFVEAARNLAISALYRSSESVRSPDVESTLDHMFRTVLSRSAKPGEMEVLRSLYEQVLADYQSKPGEAGQLLAIGATGYKSESNAEVTNAEVTNAEVTKPSTANTSLDPERADRIAAMTTVAAAIFNLDEAIHRE